MTNNFDKARSLLKEFKGGAYLFGAGALQETGKLTALTGKRAALVRGTFAGSDGYVRIIESSLSPTGPAGPRQGGMVRQAHHPERSRRIELVAQIKGARPNAPREDLFRIAREIKQAEPDVLISFGGGSTIDATKAAEVLCTLGGQIDEYFGTGLVSAAAARAGRCLRAHIAIQTVASSAAHLTKYANITDVASGQKKLLVDDAIVPAAAILDYEVTYDTPPGLTVDGAMDGLSHALEVLYGAVGRPYYQKVCEIAEVCIGLTVRHLPVVLAEPHNKEGREALCLATDLGGYAIMVGGTNGGHLTSFSLVDILPHGRACAIMNPYYTVLFAPAIEEPLRLVGRIYRGAGLTRADIDKLSGRELGLAVAQAMFELARRVGCPTRLSAVDGFSEAHIERALAAAKDPQLKMKLQNMPVPMTAEMVNRYMRPILEAARDGNPALVENI